MPCANIALVNEREFPFSSSIFFAVEYVIPLSRHFSHGQNTSSGDFLWEKIESELYI